jgi:hypothetical protein
MVQEIALKEIYDRIRLLKKTAEELKQMAHEFPALDRNTTRILASIKMLEINVSDIVDLQRHG